MGRGAVTCFRPTCFSSREKRDDSATVVVYSTKLNRDEARVHAEQPRAADDIFVTPPRFSNLITTCAFLVVTDLIPAHDSSTELFQTSDYGNKMRATSPGLTAGTMGQDRGPALQVLVPFFPSRWSSSKRFSLNGM